MNQLSVHFVIIAKYRAGIGVPLPSMAVPVIDQRVEAGLKDYGRRLRVNTTNLGAFCPCMVGCLLGFVTTQRRSSLYLLSGEEEAETLYHRDDALLYIVYVMLIWAAPIPADRWHCSLWP